LLEAAGGTLPVIKKDARGVFVLVEAGGQHGAAPAPAKPTLPPAKPVATPPSSAVPAPAAKHATPPVASTHKPGSDPDRNLFRRSTYAGVQDTGPILGESFEQKVARLKAVAAGAKQRAEDGGGDVAPPAAPAAPTAAAPASAEVAAPVVETSVAETPVASAAPPPASESTAHKPTGEADRSLLRRSTYCGVVDTGPVAGETFAQKVERLAKLSAAAKQRAEGG
jgi:hypothetical protein